jgi:5'-nucleotidase
MEVGGVLRHTTRRRLRNRTIAIALLSLLASMGVTPIASAAGTSSKSPVLRILITNDDGVSAPGIDAAVQALRALPRTNVTVVAPLTNQSGTGGKTTPGLLTVSSATTASGYPAVAVHGYPADTIVWAITQHGVTSRPELVVSGINFGENIGPLAGLSGTVGAAREAASLGIPAIATSQGVDNGTAPNFSQAAAQLVKWVQENRSALIHKSFKVGHSVTLNVPTCPTTPRGPVRAPIATSITGINIGQVNCAVKAKKFANDVQAYINGYAVLSPLGRASS